MTSNILSAAFTGSPICFPATALNLLNTWSAVVPRIKEVGPESTRFDDEGRYTKLRYLLGQYFAETFQTELASCVEAPQRHLAVLVEQKI
ncbi:unnamed protein product [Clonostachys rosea f. rosea IK726]|uniref:Uncharacterized protein n=1 Tax=Clonostachys rosea f. rosea IK726 TaxID=1349383 RepID=A0ACA9UNR6_BIOOC|nr:unnamed protein product [Clonostachys rosea f. rosea IK726]